jgi:hypothetical protein
MYLYIVIFYIYIFIYLYFYIFRLIIRSRLLRKGSEFFFISIVKLNIYHYNFLLPFMFVRHPTTSNFLRQSRIKIRLEIGLNEFRFA